MLAEAQQSRRRDKRSGRQIRETGIHHANEIAGQAGQTDQAGQADQAGQVGQAGQVDQAGQAGQAAGQAEICRNPGQTKNIVFYAYRAYMFEI